MKIIPYSDPKMHEAALIYNCRYIQCKITISVLNSRLSFKAYLSIKYMEVIHFV